MNVFSLEKLFIRRGPGLKKEQFFGFLKFKYRMAQEFGMSLGVLPELAMYEAVQAVHGCDCFRVLQVEGVGDDQHGCGDDLTV